MLIFRHFSQKIKKLVHRIPFSFFDPFFSLQLRLKTSEI